jgi:hypothetical protein
MSRTKAIAEHSHDWVDVEPLDGLYLASIGGAGQRDTRSYWLTIEIDSAGAAGAMLAAKVRSREMTVLADEVGE